REWDVFEGKASPPRGRETPVFLPDAVPSPDGRVVAAALPPLRQARGGRGPEGGGVIKVWDGARGKLLWQAARGKEGLSCLAFSPDGKTLALQEDLGFVTLREAATGKRLRRLRTGDAALAVAGAPALVFSGDGKWLA